MSKPASNKRPSKPKINQHHHGHALLDWKNPLPLVILGAGTGGLV
jgi:hypothetical protein